MSKRESEYLSVQQKHLDAENIRKIDDLYVILKVQLIVETYLDEIIFYYHKNEKANEMFNFMNIGFLKKLIFAKKFKLLEIHETAISANDMVKILKNINTLRNRFAHNLNEKLENCDDLLDEIFSKLEVVARKANQYAKYLNALSDMPKVKLGICAYGLAALLYNNILEMKMRDTKIPGTPRI